MRNQLKEQKTELWLEGAREYIKYGEALLEEYKHVKDAPAGKGPLFGADAASSKSFQSGECGRQRRITANKLSGHIAEGVLDGFQMTLKDKVQ